MSVRRAREPIDFNHNLQKQTAQSERSKLFYSFYLFSDGVVSAWALRQNADILLVNPLPLLLDWAKMGMAWLQTISKHLLFIYVSHLWRRQENFHVQ